jgi:hypothetical protein
VASAGRGRSLATPIRKAALALRRFASTAAGKVSLGRTLFHTGTYWFKKYRILVEAISLRRVASTAGGWLGQGRLAGSILRVVRGHEIAEPAHRLDDLDAELLAQPPDENLDGI